MINKDGNDDKISYRIILRGLNVNLARRGPIGAVLGQILILIFGNFFKF